MFKDIKMILFILCLGSVAIISLTFGQNLYIKSTNKGFNKNYKRILDAFEIDYTTNQIDSIFLENFKIVNSKYYIAKNKHRGSISVISKGPGLWSILTLLLVIDMDRETLVMLKVFNQGETPGLGARIEEEVFLDQFNGVSIRPELLVVKDAKKSNEVDGITGATVTSTSVEEIVNKTINELDNVFVEGLYEP